MVPLFFLIFTLSAHILTANAAPSTEKVFYNIEEIDDIFAEYVIKFNKNYNEEEYENRLAIFKINLEQINEMNKDSNMTTYGINNFTDLTFEEMSRFYMGARTGTRRSDSAIMYEARGQAPDELDYRNDGYVTAVKNQHTCASCYVFSAIGNIEGQYAKKYNQLISLSEQQGLDCEPEGQCNTGGLVDHVMKALAEQGGSMREEDYPYEDSKEQCRTDQSKIVVKVTGGYELTVQDEDALKDALAEYGPLSIGINTCEKFKAYQNGIFLSTVCDGTHHAVLLVGYGTENGVPYWIIKNSWGTIWGDQGYIRMQRGVSLCAIGSYVYTSTVA